MLLWANSRSVVPVHPVQKMPSEGCEVPMRYSPTMSLPYLSFVRTLWMIAVCGFAVTALANNERDLIGEAAGAYLGSAYLVDAAMKTPCRYAAGKANAAALIHTTKNDIFEVLDSTEQAAMEAFILEIRVKASDLTSELMHDYLKTNLDDKTRCGLLIGNVFATYVVRQENWKRIKSRIKNR